MSRFFLQFYFIYKPEGLLSIMVVSEYQKTILENGLTIVTEFIPTVRSVSVGVWVKTGTRFENRAENGVAHFLEHMLFKGTQKRTPLQIARSLESVGGNLNAFTGKELMCYYAEILDEHLERAIDVLSDILCHSTLGEPELEKERLVILDEIQSLEDTPDEMVQEVFTQNLFPDSSLGFPILGSRETVRQLNRQSLRNFFDSHYYSKNIVIAAAGNINHENLVDLSRRYFQFSEQNHPWRLQPPRKFGSGEMILERPINQAHICIGIPALPFTHEKRYEILVLNTLLGGGMSSRLFQNIREKHGLAYAIYSFLDFYFDTGLMGIYLGTDKSNLRRALNLLEKEIEDLLESPISEQELQEVKAQLKGNLMLSLESTARRMSRLAKTEIYLNRFKDIDNVIEDINKVTRESVWELTKSLFDFRHFLRVIFMPYS